MMTRSFSIPHHASLCAACAVLALASSTYAVINAGLQPVDLYQRYRNVFAGEITTISKSQLSFTLRVTDSFKGSYTADQIITVTAANDQSDAFTRRAGDGELVRGAKVAVLLGGTGRRSQNKALLYFGKSFCIGTKMSETQIEWSRSDDEAVGIDGAKISTMAGTWYGSTKQFIRLLDDISQDRPFFPRKAYIRFKEDIRLDTFDETAVSSVGLFDIDQDGDLDVYACCNDGDRVYLQMEPMVFVNATDWVGLDCASPSCSFADMNADGMIDLLTGGEIRLGRYQDNRLQLQYQELLPSDIVYEVKTSAFVELNGDGYPDIVMAMNQGGLKAFINPGSKGGAFINVTSRMGLDSDACGVKDVGFFTVGDWNNDGRTDIFFAAGKGHMLLQEAGRYAPMNHKIAFNFISGRDEAAGLTGAGCFASIFDTGALDLVVPIESGWHVIENSAGMPVDVTEYGNEISEGSYLHLATLTEDLNMDGYVDLYTISRQKSGQNRFIINRGYGSFMLASSHKHYEHMFNGPAHTRGGTAVASGDINGDRCPDLLIGNQHGEVTIILNDTLEVRKPIEHPTREVKILQETRLLTVNITGIKGVVNAKILIKNESGKTIARRDLTRNTSLGSCGPNHVYFALRNSGVYTLEVTYSDGLVRRKSVDLKTKKYLSINVDRGKEDSDNVR
ncbi:FG-GAP repeat domain-containing protein [Planctomycetota bacterium]